MSFVSFYGQVHGGGGGVPVFSGVVGVRAIVINFGRKREEERKSTYYYVLSWW